MKKLLLFAGIALLLMSCEVTSVPVEVRTNDYRYYNDMSWFNFYYLNRYNTYYYPNGWYKPYYMYRDTYIPPPKRKRTITNNRNNNYRSNANTQNTRTNKNSNTSRVRRNTSSTISPARPTQRKSQRSRN